MMESFLRKENISCEWNKAHYTELCQSFFTHSYMHISFLQQLNTIFLLP